MKASLRREDMYCVHGRGGRIHMSCFPVTIRTWEAGPGYPAMQVVEGSGLWTKDPFLPQIRKLK